MTYSASVQERQEAALLNRFGTVVQGTGQLIAAAGPTTLWTPTAGNKIRLKWTHLGTLSTATETEVTIKLGSDTLFLVPLSAPGAFAHSSVREGAVNAALTITLSPNSSVYVNYELEEVSP